MLPTSLINLPSDYLSFILGCYNSKWLCGGLPRIADELLGHVWHDLCTSAATIIPRDSDQHCIHLKYSSLEAGKLSQIRDSRVNQWINVRTQYCVLFFCCCFSFILFLIFVAITALQKMYDSHCFEYPSRYSKIIKFLFFFSFNGFQCYQSNQLFRCWNVHIDDTRFTLTPLQCCKEGARSSFSAGK